MMDVGDRFSIDFIVTEKIYQGFRSLFNDNNPIHTDIFFAHKKGFKNVIMYGNILNGFLSYFIGECLPTKDVVIHSQEIKYYNPFYLNDKLKLNAEIVDIFASVQAVEIKFRFENEHKLKIATGRIQIGLI
jgi:3-hydroxybutyryl-CoA dehydratase